ncbi:MAG: EAL domain-containing protein [Kineosporiaceae bacterium]|nr:EAL domain-containing protein [Kineosporiaceae bacterium]
MSGDRTTHGHRRLAEGSRAREDATTGRDDAELAPELDPELDPLDEVDGPGDTLLDRLGRLDDADPGSPGTRPAPGRTGSPPPGPSLRHLVLLSLGVAAFAVPAMVSAVVLAAPGLSQALTLALGLSAGLALVVAIPIIALAGGGRRGRGGRPVARGARPRLPVPAAATPRPAARRGGAPRPRRPRTRGSARGSARRTDRGTTAAAPRRPGPRSQPAGRAELLSAAEAALARRDLMGGEVALLVLDVADPGQVISSLGAAGQLDVARQSMRRLQAWLPGQDTVAQLGPSTFAVLTEGVGDHDAPQEIAARLAALLTEPMSSGQRLASVRFAIGIATSSGELGCAEDLLLAAREARLHAVEADDVAPGAVVRSSWCRYDSARHADATALGAAEIELRDALRAQRIQVSFRQIVQLGRAEDDDQHGEITGRTIAMQALPRWSRADGSTLPPEQIEALAESAGLASVLGLQVLGCGLDAVSAWYAAGFPVGRLSIRLSAGHLSDPDLVATVIGHLTRRDLPPSCLVVEVDAASVSDATQVRPVLTQLRAQGIEVVITSVVAPGAGIALLRTVPASGISLHPTVTRAMVTNGVPVAAALAACRRAGARLLLEGLSTVDELDAACRIGVDAASGSLIGQPAGPRDVTARFGRSAGTTYS